jgi:hypothetical protein
MSNITATIRPLAQVEAGRSPTIYNISITLANTEVSQVLTTNTKNFTVKVRGNSKLQIAFVSGESSTNFITVPPGAVFTSEGLNFSGTLYFQTTQPSQVVEILEWS